MFWTLLLSNIDFLFSLRVFFGWASPITCRMAQYSTVSPVLLQQVINAQLVASQPACTSYIAQQPISLLAHPFTFREPALGAKNLASALYSQVVNGSDTFLKVRETGYHFLSFAILLLNDRHEGFCMCGTFRGHGNLPDIAELSPHTSSCSVYQVDHSHSAVATPMHFQKVFARRPDGLTSQPQSRPGMFHRLSGLGKHRYRSCLTNTAKIFMMNYTRSKEVY